ncbi:MAG: hypothetical protein IIC66_05700 [candidate division Zixibacteria bacterium]|nr:hypothetical protein [candidate division Zixibacteria bacterium]
MRKFLIFTVIAVLVVSSAYAGRLERVKEFVTAKHAKIIEIECDLAAGEFTIKSGDIEEIAEIDIEYDKRTIEYEIDYSERGEKGYLFIDIDHRKNGFFKDFDDLENNWDIVLSDKFEFSINLDIGACVADFDFGGIRLTDLDIDVGAASGVIDFSEPNKSRLREINIDAGASSLEMHNLGNANFEYFEFSGGIGSYDFDFRGKYSGESKINIEIGLGAAEIILPRGVPVRVETEGGNWLSSIDFHNDDLVEIDDDIYETEDFENAKTRIILRLEVGLGSIDVYWKR